MIAPIESHLHTLDRITSILCSVRWRAWDGSRAEMQLLARDLIALREYLEDKRGKAAKPKGGSL